MKTTFKTRVVFTYLNLPPPRSNPVTHLSAAAAHFVPREVGQDCIEPEMLVHPICPAIRSGGI